MNNRERVLASLAHRQPDRVPYHVDFTQRMHARMVDFYGDAHFAKRLGNCLTGFDLETPCGWREVAPDVWEDEFGVRWNRSIDKDIGTVCNQVITRENVYDVPFPDPDDPTRYAALEQATRERGDRVIFASLGFSLFERAWTMAGMDTVLMAMVDDPPFLHRLLDRVLDFNLRVVAHACATDVDIIRFGDDWGMQTGLIMGPRLWREFIKPRIREMYALVHAAGKRVMIHSCGKVDGVFPDLIECGVDIFNPFQPEVMDVFEVKRRYGDRLSFFGGISTQRTLPYGTVAEVRAEVRRLLDEVGRNGGYIAAPSHAIPDGAKPENVAAMIDVLQTQ